MRGERLIGLGLASLAVIEISHWAFTTRARKEIGERDNWTCQGRDEDKPCVFEKGKTGEAASYKNGFWVQAAHYPEKHHHTGHGYHDEDVSNGRILCTIDHALEEIDRGNEWGAKQLLKQGVFNHDYENKTGRQWHPSIKEILEIRNRTEEKAKI